MRRRVRQLDEVLEVGERGVAPAVVEVVGRTASRSWVRTPWRRRRSSRCGPGCGRAARSSPAPWRRASGRGRGESAPARRRRRTRRRRSGRSPTGSRAPRCRPRRGSSRRCPTMICEALLADDLDGLHRPRQEGVGVGGGRGAHRLSRRPPARSPARSVSCHRLYSFVRRRAAPTGAGRPGSVDQCRPRWSVGAVAWGSAIAATNSSWNRGSVAVSIFSMPRTAAPSRAGRCRQQRHHRPGAGGVADRSDAVERAVGDEAEDHRVQRVDVRAERPGEADVGDLRVAGVLEEQVDAGAQRGLGELHGADVVLGDRQLVRASAVEDVAERAAVGLDVDRSGPRSRRRSCRRRRGSRRGTSRRAGR